MATERETAIVKRVQELIAKLTRAPGTHAQRRLVDDYHQRQGARHRYRFPAQGEVGKGTINKKQRDSVGL